MKSLAKWVLVFVCLGMLSVFADSHKKEVTIKTTMVAEGIYMLQGQGGNIGLSVGADGVFMIDDQFAPLTEKIKMAIAKVSDKKVKFVLNTHWHFDHTGGNENLGKDGVIIVSHDNVRKKMSKDNFIKAFNKKVPAASKVALPMVTFNDSMTLHMNGETIEVMHQSNAHTDGDSVIFFKNANVIHAGDVFFNGFYPFIDESSQGNIDGVIKSATYILTRTNDMTKIIPGHGKLSNKKELMMYRDTLIVLRDRMKKLIADGKTLEEVLALKPFADYDAKLGGGFLSPEAFVKTLYGVIKANQ